MGSGVWGRGFEGKVSEKNGAINKIEDLSIDGYFNGIKKRTKKPLRRVSFR